MKRGCAYRLARQRNAGQRGAEHCHALETRTEQTISNSEAQMTYNFSGNQPQGQWQRAATQSEHEIVAHTRAMLGREIARLLGLVMPDMNTGQEHDFILPIEKLNTKILLFRTIKTGVRCVIADLSHGRQTQEMAAANEHVRVNRRCALCLI